MKEEIIFDPYLKPFYDNLKIVNMNSVSTMSLENDDSLYLLQTQINEYIDELTNGAWSDDISKSLESNKETIIKMFESCKTPASEILSSLSTTINSLDESLELYNKTLEEINNKIENYNNTCNKINNCSNEEKYIVWYTTETKKDEYGNDYEDKIEHKEESKYFVDLNNLKTKIDGAISTKQKELEKYKENCNEYIEIIKGLLGPIGSEASNAALQTTTGKTVPWENIDPGELFKEFKGKDYTADGVITYDADGNITGKTYTVYDKNGNIIASGSINYVDGKPVNSNSIVRYEKPTPTSEIISHSLIGDTTGLTAYLDDEVIPVREKKKVATTYGEDTNGDGKVGFTEVVNEQKTYEDGAKLDMTYENTGTYETDNALKEKKIVHKSVGKGELIDREGIKHVVAVEEERGVNASYTKETNITSEEGKEEVHAVEVGISDKKNSIGADVESKAATVEVAQEDGSKNVTVSHEKKMTSGDNEYSSTFVQEFNDETPDVTKTTFVNDSTGEEYVCETYYNENGDLCEKVTVDGVLFTDNKVESDIKEVTITGSDGTTVTNTYNLGTTSDREKLIEDIDSQIAINGGDPINNDARMIVNTNGEDVFRIGSEGQLDINDKVSISFAPGENRDVTNVCEIKADEISPDYEMPQEKTEDLFELPKATIEPTVVNHSDGSKTTITNGYEQARVEVTTHDEDGFTGVVDRYVEYDSDGELIRDIDFGVNSKGERVANEYANGQSNTYVRQGLGGMYLGPNGNYYRYDPNTGMMIRQ